MDLKTLKDYELGNLLEWSSLVLLRVYSGTTFGAEELRGWDSVVEDDALRRQLLGYVLIIDPGRGAQALYKLPGGHKKAGETPLNTAVREVEGETGLTLNPLAFRFVGKYLGWRKDHWKIIFHANISEEDRNWMHSNQVENEGEVPRYFTIEGFYKMVRDGKMLREHYEKLLEYALVAPLGRDKGAA